MHTRYRNTVWALVVIVAFAGGVASGVYYRDEVLVWLYNLGWLTPPAVTTSVPPATPAAHTSVMNLPGIPEALPLIYSDTLDEPTIQEYLKQGAVVLPLGTSFGEPGNVVVTAHSSGTEAFGPYRFAFAKLAELNEGQEYSVTTPTAVYTYRVYGKEVVWPHEVDRLPRDERVTTTLVTCWPLWTNFKRLLVHSELVNTEYRI